MLFSKKHILSSLLGSNLDQSYKKNTAFNHIEADKCRNIIGGTDSNNNCGNSGSNNNTQPNDPPIEGEDEI